MILTCPECATRYFVDDAKLGVEGRTVRCSACGHKWKAEAEPELELVTTVEGALARDVASAEPAPTAEEPPAIAIPRQFRAKQVEKRTMRKAMVHGIVWASLAAVAAAILGAAALFRVDVVRLVPRAASAYAMVGLTVNPTGLAIEKVSARPGLEGGHAALIVSGEVRNVSEREVRALPIRIQVLDARGEPVAEQVEPAEPGRIAPGETRHFVATVLDPPGSAKDVELAFVLGAPAPAALRDARPEPQPDGAEPETPKLRKLPAGESALPAAEPADAEPPSEAPAAEDAEAHG